MTYGILDANKNELKLDGRNKRTSNYDKAYEAWKRLYPVIICFLVCWECDDCFVVLEPQRG